VYSQLAAGDYKPSSGELPLLSVIAFIHQMAPHSSTHLTPAQYSFIDPKRMKG